MVTLKKLAEELNVSVSTVSKALNDNDEISLETIERVKELAKLYNYKPNRAALNLKSRNTKTIGVIIPDILNHFFAKVLFSIEREAARHGYNIITCLSNESYDKEMKSLEILSNGSVDGFIVSVAEETQLNNSSEHFNSIMNEQIPLVMFDRVLNDVNCTQVIINDYVSAYEATNHLLKEGRRKIALLSNISDLSVGKLRISGYKKALLERKDYMNEPFILSYLADADCEFKIESLLVNHHDIDGIIAIDNTSGVIALHKALKLKRKVPKDMSIIGFSDSNVLQFTNPKLSTIAQHPIDIGLNATKLVIREIENQLVKNKKMSIKTELVLRGTTL
ncbi:LacI family DNA-binding transcriptional regulator [Hanstruepera flava]|uniref:LacI family DNA-binding transcriptional regulator n=1 Tax=Hanstruepera flava TaxID=2930218 RepID=UPI0020291EC0|nr:LacI family DNA-binding transcriptional regulator [Hanstruepera flava]